MYKHIMDKFKTFEEFLDFLKEQTTEKVNVDKLQEILTYREKFDPDHLTTVNVGRLPKFIAENDNIVFLDCIFDEGIDDWITLYQYCDEE